VKHNFSSVYQICDSGSGQILLPGQLNLSPGFAKIAPRCLAHRENLLAKVPGPVTGWAKPPTLTGHTRWPLVANCEPPNNMSLKNTFNYVFHQRLNKWVVRRYKRFKGSHKKAGRWIWDLAKRQPDLFVHWQHGFETA